MVAEHAGVGERVEGEGELAGAGDPEELAVAPLATMSESKGSGSAPSSVTCRWSQSTPVTVANRKVTLSARPKMARIG